MTTADADFWSVVALTTRYEDDPARQIAELRTELRALPVEKIEAFERAFDAIMKRSYAWDLWGATYVIHGGVSDDAFEYFRCWLVSKGQAVFESVLADPDHLAELLPPKIDGVLEFEDFAYVARSV